jgi:hypothetical protein
MVQYWEVIAPEKKACFLWCYKLGEFLFDGTPESIVIQLAVPSAEHVEKKFSPVPVTFPANSSPLLDLPNEVLNEILSQLDIGSLFCLSTCSQLLLCLCRKRIVSFFKSECGRLAGTSLICVGDYLAPGDYPPGIDWRGKTGLSNFTTVAKSLSRFPSTRENAILQDTQCCQSQVVE